MNKHFLVRSELLGERRRLVHEVSEEPAQHLKPCEPAGFSSGSRLNNKKNEFRWATRTPSPEHRSMVPRTSGRLFCGLTGQNVCLFISAYQRLTLRLAVKHDGGSVVVWASFASSGPAWWLTINNWNIKSARCQKILEEDVRLRCDLLQQDSGPKRTLSVTTKF